MQNAFQQAVYFTSVHAINPPAAAPIGMPGNQPFSSIASPSQSGIICRIHRQRSVLCGHRAWSSTGLLDAAIASVSSIPGRIDAVLGDGSSRWLMIGGAAVFVYWVFKRR